MKKSSLRYGLAIVLMAGAAVAAQPDRPVVTMTIAAAGEKPHEVEVRESGLAEIKVKGAAFEFRPTIQDSKPWTRVVVTIFKMDPQVEPVGEVEVAIEDETRLQNRGTQGLRQTLNPIALGRRQAMAIEVTRRPLGG